MTSKIEAIINRSPVSAIIGRHKKLADADLYCVLHDCMEIAEICQHDKHELAVLNRLIAGLKPKKDANRVYIEQSSDIFQRVCRFMFHGEEHTANISRYAIALREAANQGVKSKTLVKELMNGGINKFFLSRPSQTSIIATKTLRLDKQIQHLKGEEIALKLKRNVDNTYSVLEFSGAER